MLGVIVTKIVATLFKFVQILVLRNLLFNLQNLTLKLIILKVCIANVRITTTYVHTHTRMMCALKPFLFRGICIQK